MKTLPADAVAYQRTREFTELTIPAGLQRRHSTKAGVWARICVLQGRLLYRVLDEGGLAEGALGEGAEEHVLTPASAGVVEPEVPHEVAPLGEVRFFVEFLRCGKA